MHGMSEAVLVALVSAGISLAGTVVTVLASSRASQEKLRGEINVVRERIETLSGRVEKHNGVIERTYGLETRLAVVERRLAEPGGR